MTALLPIRPRITPATHRAFLLSIEPIIKQIAYLEGFRPTQLVMHADGSFEVTHGSLPDCIEGTIVLLRNMIARECVAQFGQDAST